MVLVDVYYASLKIRSLLFLHHKACAQAMRSLHTCTGVLARTTQWAIEGRCTCVVHACAYELVWILLGRTLMCNRHRWLVHRFASHEPALVFRIDRLLCADECAGIRASGEASLRVPSPAHVSLLAWQAINALLCFVHETKTKERASGQSFLRVHTRTHTHTHTHTQTQRCPCPALAHALLLEPGLC
jgi:hypothetical protein